MRYFQYFIVSATAFYICWIVVLLLYKVILITTSSDATLIAFAFGGILSPFICFWLATRIDRYLINQEKHSRLDMREYNSRDTAIDTYVQEVGRAKNPEDIDKLEERFKDAI